MSGGISRALSLLLVCSIGLSGCASMSTTTRVLIGVSAGGAAGAGGGVAFSPNADSRGLNALVFGLSGALLGGLVAVLTDRNTWSKPTDLALKNREMKSDEKGREFVVTPGQPLPDFLKGRVQPVVIEEYIETDRVSEEGVLHEPHRAYRIKRPAELFADPGSPKKEGGAK